MRFLPPRHAILKKRGGWFDGKLSTALNDEARDESPCFKTEYSCRRLLYTIDVTVFAPAEKLHACKVLRFRMYSLHPPCSHLVLRPRSGPIPSGTLLPLIGAGTQSALRRESRRRPTWHPDPIWFHAGHPYLQQLLHKHTTVLNLCAKLKEPGTCVQFVRLSAFLAKWSLIWRGSLLRASRNHLMYVQCDFFFTHFFGSLHGINNRPWRLPSGCVWFSFKVCCWVKV